MKAEEFINEKLGDKNWTHSDFKTHRSEIEQWLEEFAQQDSDERFAKANHMISTEIPEMLFNDVEFVRIDTVRSAIETASGKII